jgi:hypothetical protein
VKYNDDLVAGVKAGRAPADLADSGSLQAVLAAFQATKADENRKVEQEREDLEKARQLASGQGQQDQPGHPGGPPPPLVLDLSPATRSVVEELARMLGKPLLEDELELVHNFGVKATMIASSVTATEAAVLAVAAALAVAAEAVVTTTTM